MMRLAVAFCLMAYDRDRESNTVTCNPRGTVQTLHVASDDWPSYLLLLSARSLHLASKVLRRELGALPV